eukprot:g21245.t1
MSGKEERKATPEMIRKEKAARSRLRTKMMNDLESWGIGSPEQESDVPYWGSQSKANLCCGSRFACTARVHVAFITMFEETEATKASGHRGFRVMLYLGDNWGHFMINKGGGSDLRQHFYPGYVLKALPHSYVVGPPIKGVGREGMIIKLQCGWWEHVLCFITGKEFKEHQGRQGDFSIPQRHATVVEKWLQWKNKGELVKETVTARFHGFRMKAASDLLQLIDENVRIEEVEEDDDYDDIPLFHLVRVPEVLQQNAPPAEVIPDDDEPYPAEDPDAPAPEVNRMSPPPVLRVPLLCIAERAN